MNYGILALVVLIGGVFALGGSSPKGGGTNCGRVELTPGMITSKMDLLSAHVSNANPKGSGFEFCSKLMQIIYPSCPWARDTIATIAGPDGEIDWQEMVAAMGVKTVEELATDPEFEGILTPGKEGIGEPGSANAIAAAAAFVGIELPESVR